MWKVDNLVVLIHPDTRVYPIIKPFAECLGLIMLHGNDTWSHKIRGMNGRFYKIGSSLAQRRRGNGAIGIYDITNPDHRRALTRHVFSLGRRSDRRPTRNRSS